MVYKRKAYVVLRAGLMVVVLCYKLGRRKIWEKGKKPIVLL